VQIHLPKHIIDISVRVEYTKLVTKLTLMYIRNVSEHAQVALPVQGARY